MSKKEKLPMPKGYKTYTAGTLQHRSKTELSRMIVDQYKVISDMHVRLTKSSVDGPVFSAVVDQLQAENDELKRTVGVLRTNLKHAEEQSTSWWKFW